MMCDKPFQILVGVLLLASKSQSATNSGSATPSIKFASALDLVKIGKSANLLSYLMKIKKEFENIFRG